VPLGSASRIRCAHCGTETPIPPSHLALQAAHLAFDQNRALAKQLYGELGRPPSWLTRTLGRGAVATVPILVNVLVAVVQISFKLAVVGVAMLCGLTIGAGWPVGAVIRFIRVHLYITRASEPVPPIMVLPITVMLLIVLFGIPAMRWQRELTIKDVRMSAHAGLAAVPPVRPGGPSCCRNCGAALDVPQGALGVPYPYCKCDNLVALPAAWLAQVKAGAHADFERIDVALDAMRAARGNARESYWSMFVGTVIALALTLPMAWMLDAAHVKFRRLSEPSRASKRPARERRRPGPASCTRPSRKNASKNGEWQVPMLPEEGRALKDRS